MPSQGSGCSLMPRDAVRTEQHQQFAGSRFLRVTIAHMPCPNGGNLVQNLDPTPATPSPNPTHFGCLSSPCSLLWRGKIFFRKF